MNPAVNSIMGNYDLSALNEFLKFNHWKSQSMCIIGHCHVCRKLFTNYAGRNISCTLTTFLAERTEITISPHRERRDNSVRELTNALSTPGDTDAILF